MLNFLRDWRHGWRRPLVANVSMLASSIFVTRKIRTFRKARDAGSVVMTKDEDFVRLVERNSPPPQVIWVTAGNMSNARFKSLLLKTFPDAMSLITGGETVVEIQLEK
jgi:predicted nuclease of predicted toxin-antitoxin system